MSFCAFGGVAVSGFNAYIAVYQGVFAIEQQVDEQPEPPRRRVGTAHQRLRVNRQFVGSAHPTYSIQ